MRRRRIGLCLFAFIAGGLMHLPPAAAEWHLGCGGQGGTAIGRLETSYFSPAVTPDRLDYRSILLDYDSFLEEIEVPKKFYFPRYRIRTEDVSGQLHYGIQLKSEGTDWLLTIPLESYPDPALGDAARTARPVNDPANYKVYLKYTIPGAAGGQAVSRRVQFSEVIAQPWGMQARLRRTTLPEQDELYSALSDIRYHTQLAISHGPLPVGYEKPLIRSR